MMKKVSYFKVTFEGSIEHPSPQELLEEWVKLQAKYNTDLNKVEFTKTKVEILGETTFKNKIS